MKMTKATTSSKPPERSEELSTTTMSTTTDVQEEHQQQEDQVKNPPSAPDMDDLDGADASNADMPNPGGGLTEDCSSEIMARAVKEQAKLLQEAAKSSTTSKATVPADTSHLGVDDSQGFPLEDLEEVLELRRTALVLVEEAEMSRSSSGSQNDGKKKSREEEEAAAKVHAQAGLVLASSKACTSMPAMDMKHSMGEGGLAVGVTCMTKEQAKIALHSSTSSNNAKAKAEAQGEQRGEATANGMSASAEAPEPPHGSGVDEEAALAMPMTALQRSTRVRPTPQPGAFSVTPPASFNTSFSSAHQDPSERNITRGATVQEDMDESARQSFASMGETIATSPLDHLVSAQLVTSRHLRNEDASDEEAQEVFEAKPALEGYQALIHNKRFKLVVAAILLIPLAIILPLVLTVGAKGNTTVETVSNFTLCGTRELNQADYRGEISVTESGDTCQRWDEQVGNACRCQLCVISLELCLTFLIGV